MLNISGSGCARALLLMTDVKITRGVSGNLYVVKPGKIRWIGHRETEQSQEPLFQRISFVNQNIVPCKRNAYLWEGKCKLKFNSIIFKISYYMQLLLHVIRYDKAIHIAQNNDAKFVLSYT